MEKTTTLDTDPNPIGNSFINLRSGKRVLKHSQTITSSKRNKKQQVAAAAIMEIHDDISFSVLSKLPIKSLKQFESVGKSWSLLSENHFFMKMFRDNLLCNSYYYGGSLVLRVEGNDQDDVYSLSGDKFDDKVKLDCLIPFENETYFHFFGFGSINGKFLLLPFSGLRHVLWKPATQKFKFLPHGPFESYVSARFRFLVASYVHGFGYDSFTDDLKVIRYIVFPDATKRRCKYVGKLYFEPSWEIYSLRSNSWRKLDVDMLPSLDCTEGTHLYMDGVCHWLCKNDYGFWKNIMVHFNHVWCRFT